MLIAGADPGEVGRAIPPWAGSCPTTVSADTVPTPVDGVMEGVDPKTLPVMQRVNLLLKALNGARRTNEALARCADGEAMLDVLQDASAKLGLGLSRADLQNTPPIRDWIWWKNKEALLTIGDNKPRYQQDARQTPRSPETGAAGGSGASEPERKRFFGLF